MRFATISTLFLSLLLAGCQMTGDCCADPQAVLASVAASHDDCTRLSLHCPKDGGALHCCASTDAARVGTASDDEDARAMKSGETIVLEEGTALDVTVPLMKDGAYCCVCGVTLEANGRTREQVVERATMIAKAVQAQVGSCDCSSAASGSSQGGEQKAGGCCSDGGAASSCASGGGSCCAEGGDK